ncbi:MAG: hypothetical protein HOP17_06080 [Acidobacteria bacterium]|nr:hypothetical protein [Acidobacteriota bacterium]
MNLDKNTQDALQRMTDAVNEAVKNSLSVKDALGALREIGYEPRLTVRLEPLPVEDFAAESESIETDFTEADRKALGRMLIRVR